MPQKIINNIKNNSFDICIYQNQCPDGMAAFWCIKKWGVNKNIIGLSMHYTDIPEKKILKDKNIIFVGICLDEEKMNIILDYCTNITVIDNNKSSYNLLNTLIENDKPIFDLIYYEDKSACQIAWNIFYSTQNKEPSFIKYIGTRNLEQGWGEIAHNFCLGYHNKFRNITYNSIDALYHSYILKTDLIDNIICKGEEIFSEILKKYDIIDKEYGTFINKFIHENSLYVVRICRENELNKNDFAIYLCKKYKNIDFAVIWSEVKDDNNNILNENHIIYIKTIKDNINLLPIAKSFGGNGHSKSCSINNTNVFNTFYNHINEETFTTFLCKLGIFTLTFSILYFLVKK